MSSILITGTDTGVGKTLVCGYLARFLAERGRNVTTQKWVQTGCPERPEDLEVHCRLMGEAPEQLSPQTVRLRCPYLFELPASPHLAAAREDAQVDPAVIRRAHQQLAARHDIVLVEGAGGVHVPLTEELLLGDLAARLGLAAVVVVRNALGCINHSLLTVEALRRRQIPVLGLIFNAAADAGEDAVRRDNPRIIGKVAGVPVLGEFPRLDDPLAGQEEFEPIGEEFARRWEAETLS